MRGFFATFEMGFKDSMRSILMWVVMMAFPILIILILGTTLENMLNPTFDFEPQPLAVVAEPHSPLGQFVQSGEIARFFDITFTDRQTAERLAEAGEIIAAFVEESGQASVLVPAANLTMTDVALSIFHSYRQMGAAVTLAAMEGRDISTLPGAGVQTTDRPLGTHIPRAIDYYAVTMLIMILMFSGMNGADLYYRGLISEMGRRIRVSPVSRPALVGGLLTSSTVAGFLQILPAFAFTAFVYNVYWGSRIPLVLLTMLMMVVFSQALGIMLTMLFRNEALTTNIINAVIVISTFVSGGYVRIEWGETLSRVFQYAPNAMAHTVIFGAIYGGNEARMMTSLAILGIVCVVLFGLALLFGRRRLV